MTADIRTTDFFGSDIWRPEGVKPLLKRLTVIGPYPTVEFFRLFFREFAPREILLVVDDSWDRDEIKRIEKYCDSKGAMCQIRCASCRNGALLHAKIYLAEWGNRGTSKRRLIWGSLNASKSGFQTNGEAASAATLDSDQERSVIPYFHQLWDEAVGSVKMANAVLLDGVRLVLPPFDFRPFEMTDEPESFDAWVQAERLCYQFEKDQSFAKLSLTLKESLPNDEAKRIVNASGLLAETQRDTLRFPYLGKHDKEKGGPHWRASYFLESWLGFWTSDSCFRANAPQFRLGPRVREQREETLGTIKLSDEGARWEWCKAFIECIHNLLGELRKAGRDPGRYLRMCRNDIEKQHYERNAWRQLCSHYERANDPVFQQRYIAGYQFFPVPRFRGTEAVSGGSFDDFLVGLCETVVNALNRRNDTNRLVKRLRRKLPSDAGDMTGKRLLDAIRKQWPEIGAEDAVKAVFLRQMVDSINEFVKLAHSPQLDVVVSHARLVETGLDLFDKAGRHNFRRKMVMLYVSSLFR
jgi:hypothetical protein